MKPSSPKIPPEHSSRAFFMVCLSGWINNADEQMPIQISGIWEVCLWYAKYEKLSISIHCIPLDSIFRRMWRCSHNKIMNHNRRAWTHLTERWTIRPKRNKSVSHTSRPNGSGKGKASPGGACEHMRAHASVRVTMWANESFRMAQLPRSNRHCQGNELFLHRLLS